MQGRFTIFSLALKNLRRKRIRTVILIIAIALLVSILVFALSFVRRVDSGIKIAAGRLGADLLIVPTGSRGEAEDVLLENRVKSFYMDKDIIERVRKIDGITEVTSQIYLTTLVGICCDVPDSIVVAFNQDTDFVIKPWLTKTLNRRLLKGEAIVGSESSFNINMGLIEVDGVLFGNIFHMIGVLDQTGTGLDNAIFIDEENIDAILRKGKANIKPNQISIIFAKIKEGLDPYTVAGRVEDSIIEVDAISRRDIGSKILSTLRDINRIFAITVIFASVLAAFLAWAVFSAVVNERAKEVGIMRAIGAKESQIASLFLTEILVISLIGSIIGIAAGTSYSFILTKGFSIMKNISTDLSLIERVFIGIFGLLSGTGICIGGAFLPVLKLKKMEPLVIIKGE